MSKARTHLIYTDAHASPEHNNDRAEWLGKLIVDLKPDIVINGGDLADMASLASYDKGTKSFHNKSYVADYSSAVDFQERLWWPVRKTKRRLPMRVSLIGNHEQRISRAINSQHELDGAIGYKDLCLEEYNDEVVYYNGATPGNIILDGVTYAHYMVSGVSGRPIGGEHPAYSHLVKQHSSCVVGHSHVLDYCQRTRADGKKIAAVVAGCFSDWFHHYAGDGGRVWWRGVVVLKNVEEGNFDIQTINLNTIKKEYSK